MKKRFIAGVMAIVLLAVAVAAGAGVWGIASWESASARQSLRELLTLVEAQAGADSVTKAVAAFELAAPDKRLTVIGADGTVLADSEAETSENHASRPEVQEALASGWGESVRHSDTLSLPMLYVAKRFVDGSVGRAAMPLSTIDSMVWDSLPMLIVAVLAALLLALLLARRLARTLLRPLDKVRQALQGVLSGDGSGTLSGYEPEEELQPVFHLIARLMDRLGQDLEQIRGDMVALQKAGNARQEFTANVSHELKTPLTSIKGVSELLSSGLVRTEEDRQHFYTTISVETDRLIALIDDILDLSELETATPGVTDETASPLETANEVAALLRPEAERRNIAISVSGDAGKAKLPTGRLWELLQNLMDNAVRYCKDGGGRVEVTVRREDGGFAIRVADDGIGIPAEAQPHLFERFYRVDKGRSRASGGTGLGLAIVKHICQLYGGSVELVSTPEKGSAFTVRLPA